MSRLIDATEAKPGVTILVNNEPCIVKSQDISKTGKHGASKCRIEAVGIFDNKKRVVAVPGHERFEAPMVKKSKSQIISIDGNKASVMDLESFETLDAEIDEDMKGSINENDTVEYWEFENKRIIKRKA